MRNKGLIVLALCLFGALTLWWGSSHFWAADSASLQDDEKSLATANQDTRDLAVVNPQETRPPLETGGKTAKATLAEAQDLDEIIAQDIDNLPLPEKMQDKITAQDLEQLNQEAITRIVGSKDFNDDLLLFDRIWIMNPGEKADTAQLFAAAYDASGDRDARISCIRLSRLLGEPGEGLIIRALETDQAVFARSVAVEMLTMMKSEKSIDSIYEAYLQEKYRADGERGDRKLTSSALDALSRIGGRGHERLLELWETRRNFPALAAAGRGGCLEALPELEQLLADKERIGPALANYTRIALQHTEDRALYARTKELLLQYVNDADAEVSKTAQTELDRLKK